MPDHENLDVMWRPNRDQKADGDVEVALVVKLSSHSRSGATCCSAETQSWNRFDLPGDPQQGSGLPRVCDPMTASMRSSRSPR